MRNRKNIQRDIYFKREVEGAYKAAYRNNWLDEFFN